MENYIGNERNKHLLTEHNKYIISLLINAYTVSYIKGILFKIDYCVISQARQEIVLQNGSIAMQGLRCPSLTLLNLPH